MSPNSNNFPEDTYLFPPVAESARLLVGCSREDYSASRIARAVEDCDAHVLNLNVTSMGAPDTFDDADPDGADAGFPVVFDLRVSHRSAEGVGRSLERYGYTVIDTRSARDADSDTARRRLDHLFRYLEI
ncbi:MAG: hypothetical protein NC418_08965 [Muribaculaceae bacterium]|nr:hypothetical protein [Muribaculaceae bacterium]